MAKKKANRPKSFQLMRTNIQSSILNLIGDGALPSPVLLCCCSNKECVECYVALALLSDYGSVENLKKEDYVALESYMGFEPDTEEQPDKRDQPPPESDEEGSDADDTESLPPKNVLDKIAHVWKTALPSMQQRSLCPVGYIRSLMHFPCTPGYVAKSKHNSRCASCRRDYEPLYQEFGVFLYPENRGELGTPPLFYGKLSDGTIIARTFQLYLHTTDKSAQNGKEDKDDGKGFFTADVALLEMVDPDLVTKEDHHVLRLNGFAHEIDANGTIYWARGIVFHGFRFVSKCVLKAAVETRNVAHYPRNRESSIVCCTETIKKWVENMGYFERGFFVVAAEGSARDPW